MILITEFMDAAAVDRLASVHETTYAPELADTQGEIPGRMAGVRALVVRNRTRVTAELLDAAPALTMVGRLGVGLDNIDLASCKARGVVVVPATGANTLSVAEYVVTQALVLLRGAYLSRGAVVAGNWPRGRLGQGREAAGRVLGLVGFGAIAQETARLARAMGMTVCAYDPFLPGDHPAWAGVASRSLAGVLAEADAVSLHVPLTDATRHMIDAAALAEMPAGAVLINAARGGVVDEAALAAALRAGHLGGAALDVFETEPLSAAAAEVFAGLDNLVLTPHIAGVTADSNQRVSAMIAEAVLAHLGAA